MWKHALLILEDQPGSFQSRSLFQYLRTHQVDVGFGWGAGNDIAAEMQEDFQVDALLIEFSEAITPTELGRAADAIATWASTA